MALTLLENFRRHVAVATEEAKARLLMQFRGEHGRWPRHVVIETENTRSNGVALRAIAYDDLPEFIGGRVTETGALVAAVSYDIPPDLTEEEVAAALAQGRGKAGGRMSDEDWPVDEALFSGDMLRDVARTLNFEAECAAVFTVLLRKYGAEIVRRGLDKALAHDASPSEVEAAARMFGVLSTVTKTADRLECTIRESGWTFAEQAHLDDGPERRYWHHGRLMALRDLEFLLTDWHGGTDPANLDSD